MLLPDTVPADLGGASLAKGDVITAHRPDGTCVGRLVWQGQAAALPVWGDDEVTEDVDGLVDGEAIHLQVHDASEGTTYASVEAELAQPDPLYRAKAEYHTNGFYLVKALRIAGGANTPPTASFTVKTRSGVAPLKNAFDASASNDADGTISKYTWDFGDGATGEGLHVTHTYQSVGTFAATLTVTDDDGAKNSTKQTITVSSPESSNPDSPKSPNDPREDVALAIGESAVVQVGQPDRTTWHTVELQGTYADPVVFLQTLSYNGWHPMAPRLRNITATSFEFQLQEWAYLDGSHTEEAVGYLVIEAGRHELEDGTVVEVGRHSAGAKATSVRFAASFAEAPVVLSQVQTVSDATPVGARTDAVGRSGFQVLVQTEEAVSGHGAEQVGWLAVAPGTGQSGGRRFEARLATADHAWQQVGLASSFAEAPVVLASVQTLRGSDPVNVRVDKLGGSGLQVMVQEEQSKDEEVGHVKEDVALFALSPGLLTTEQVAVSRSGTSESLEQASLNTDALDTLVVEQAPVDVPETFELDGNYPNPFNPATTIRYGLPEQAAVRLVVYDVVGRQVAVLVEATQQAGYHEVRFDASRLPSGVYLYRLQAGAFTEAGSMVLMK